MWIKETLYAESNRSESCLVRNFPDKNFFMVAVQGENTE
jgi:hypothetical protein